MKTGRHTPQPSSNNLDEAPRHLALVPPSECEVVCGHPSPLLTGFVCVNDPHEPGPHYYAKAAS